MLLRNILSLVLVIGLSYSSFSQSVTISMTADCFNPAVTVPYAFDVNGKPAYDTPSGNLGGFVNVQVSVLWDNNQWQINIGGGTVAYINPSTAAIPPANGWQAFTPSFPLGTCQGNSTPPTLSGAVLPIDLVSFKAEKIEEKIHLDWTTALEVNNEGFAVERSIDGSNWNRIYFVEGQGSSNHQNDYEYIDSNPRNGVNYFRLMQMDFDGQSEYSNIIKVEFYGLKNELIIAPNPFSGKVRFDLSSINDYQSEVVVYDCSGHIVLTLDLEVDNDIQYRDLSFLESGVYFVRFIAGETSQVQKVIKY